MNNIKEHSGLKYYTGAYPPIKKLFREGKRPVEFGNKIWPVTLVLIDHLDKNRDQFKDLKVLEIGCGWGMLGVYMAKILNCQVTCSDLDEYVLPIVTMHAELNSVDVKTKQASFNDLSPEFLAGFDLIIGAEICYSEEVAQDIISLIARGKKSGVKQVIIADPNRPDFEDVSTYCNKNHQTTHQTLPGSKNGKTTTLMISALN